jgi:hypothetical protein
MKSSFVFVLSFLALFTFGNELFAFGRKQAAEDKKPINNEWILCITAFDSSSMSPAWQNAGDNVVRSLAGTLQNLDLRFRGEKESGYYRNYALTKARAAASDALVKKRNERDLLIFKGDPEWKYRKDLKTVDAAILKLEEDLANVEVSPVEEIPVLTLSEKNRAGTFPEPPKPGWEYRFCTEEKADAFLCGNLSEYYGRIYLEIKMYTRYTNSYSYEDNVLFSNDDFNKAMDELSGRLAVAATESFPSMVLVHTDPPDAMVLIDNSFASQGETEMRAHSPGMAEISVYAENYAPASFPLELNPGELAELFIDLTPLSIAAFEADVPASPGSKVFLGSLYVGEAPLTLELPRSKYTYISVETPDSEIGSVILKDNNMVKGNAQFARKDGDQGKADFFTVMPPLQEEKRVEKTRRSFYNTYGAFWIVLPVSLLTAGIAGTYIGINENAELIQRGANIAWGTSLGLTFFQIFRYLYVSGGDSTPIVKVPPKANDE